MNSNQPSRPTLRLVGDVPEEFHQGAWRHEQTLVLGHHATLPDRCALCNAPAEGHTLDKRLLWHHPALLLLPLIAPPIGLAMYAVLAWLTRKSMPAALPLCARHRRRRAVVGIAGLAMLPSFPVLAVVSISTSEPSLMLPGLALSLLGAVVLIIGRNELWPARITDEYAFVRGASAEWLDALPEWSEELSSHAS